MLDRLPLLDETSLVLQYDDVVELHDLHRGEVLARLQLRAALIRRHKEEGGAVEHRGHEDVVAWAVDEGDVLD